MTHVTFIRCSGAACIAGGTTSETVAEQEALASFSPDLGGTWQQATRVGLGDFVDVSCADHTDCVGIVGTGTTDSYGQGVVIVSRDGGRTWVQPARMQAPVGNEVSCTPQLCVLVGATFVNPVTTNAMYSTAYMSLDGARTWTTLKPPGSAGLSSVSCPTSNACVAVGGLGSPEILTLRR